MKEGKIFFTFAVLILMINFTVAVRLPVVGSDTDAWGDILNEFLGVSMNGDGSLRNINNSVGGFTSIDGSLDVLGDLLINGTSINSSAYIPTIVESGNNSNGYYVKYIDGTMVQWGNVSCTVAIATGFQGGYRSNSGECLTYYPVSFTNSDVVYSPTVLGGVAISVIASINSNSTRADNLFTSVSSSTSATRALMWYAVGKWTNTPYNTSTITVGGGIPAGAIVPFNRTSCPVGWTLADGSNGTPDLRGIFIRGSGTNSILKYANGTYLSATQGSYANDSFQGHQHYWSIGGATGGSVVLGQIAAGTWATTQGTFYPTIPGFYYNDGAGTPRTGNETSPAYYSTIYCVKVSEDSSTSNSIWATSGNNVQLANASKNLNISGNLTLGLGQIAYNSSANKYYYYNTSDWVEIGSGASSSSTSYVNSIVDSGNNSYGSYIKFIDGTMIQWGSTPVTAYPNTINFPASFSDRNYTFIPSWNSRNVGSTSDTTANERPFTSDSSSHAVNLTQVWVVSSGVPQSVGYLDWYATGKWTETPYDNSTITVGGGIPSGAIVPFNRTSCPVGWTLADGSNGTPDLRGIFIRGSGTNSILSMANGTYFSATQGSYKNDSFQGHEHYIGDPNGGSYLIGTETSDTGSGVWAGNGAGSPSPNPFVTKGFLSSPRYSNETTPAYYSTIYCVKMTQDTEDSNTIWATSGNNVLLSNSSMNVNITSNLSVGGVTTLNQSVWIYPSSLGASWVNYGSGGYSNFGYTRDSMGYLRFRGLIKNGLTGGPNVLITLPVGYRPLYSSEFIVAASGTAGSANVVILSTGAVYVESLSSNTWVSFDNVAIPLN